MLQASPRIDLLVDRLSTLQDFFTGMVASPALSFDFLGFTSEAFNVTQGFEDVMLRL